MDNLQAKTEELAPSVYVVYTFGKRTDGSGLDTQIVGVYESESEAREVADTRDKHLAAKTEMQWQPHGVEKTEFFKATSAV